MSERFTDHLRALAEPIWAAQHAHPFVRGIADGTLDLDKFRFWVRQDYRFLIDYARLFGIAASRSPDLATMTTFAELLHSTLRTEMALHRAYGAELGISRAELEAEPMAPENAAYTDFLLRTALLGGFAELAAALLPCMWGFSEIGQRMTQSPRPADSRYARWIVMYADPEFARLANWCRDLVDRLAEDSGPEMQARMETAFLASSRHELAFWDMAWRS